MNETTESTIQDRTASNRFRLMICQCFVITLQCLALWFLLHIPKSASLVGYVSAVCAASVIGVLSKRLWASVPPTSK